MTTMIESLAILFLGSVLLFGVVFGVVWAGAKIFASGKPVNMRKVLVISIVATVVLAVCLLVVLANGFSNLPNQ